MGIKTQNGKQCLETVGCESMKLKKKNKNKNTDCQAICGSAKRKQASQTQCAFSQTVNLIKAQDSQQFYLLGKKKKQQKTLGLLLR